MKYLNKYWLTISIVTLLIICIIMVFIYFKNVSNNFSTTSDDWGNFGGYLGSITGLLAFAGVLYSLQQSNKTHTEDSERDTFFQLLELHTNKVNAVEYNGKNGVEAFKELANIANKNLIVLVLKKIIMNEDCVASLDKNKINSLHNENPQLYKVLQWLHGIYFNGNFSVEQFIQLITKQDDNELKDYISQRYTSNEDVMVYVNSNIPMDIGDCLRIVADFIYKEYGYILGHYFRNMYYVMDTIDGFSDKKNYKELFRAQLSRYELALGLFNAVSSNSSKRMICLLEDFKIFKDTYKDDVAVLNPLMNNSRYSNKSNQEKMLAITNEILNEWKP